MIQHFSFKPLYENTQLPGWGISFYYNQQYYKGEYRKDGTIKWLGITPAVNELATIENAIHELMLFHVYD